MELVTLMKSWEITTINSSGIISELYDIYNSTNENEELEIPFIPNEQFAARLNNYYYFGWSGDKYSSPLVEKYKELTESPVSWQVEVAKAFWETHKEQLLRQWENFTKEYDPIEDYHIVETTQYEHSGEGDTTDTGSEENKWTGDVENSGKTKESSKVYTYDGSQANVSEVTTDFSGVGGTDKTTTHYADLKNTRTFNQRKKAMTESATDDLTIEKSGNLGINPVSQFLKDDIELWKWNFFKNVFFPALDSFIAIPIY